MDTVALEIESQTPRQVVFRIHNQGSAGIFFGWGCQPPQVERLFDGNWIAVVQSITEAVPEAKYLAPGAQLTCQWNLSGWQDTTLEGAARFQSYLERSQVPPGRYRLTLTYYASKQDFSEYRNPAQVYSQSFVVKN
jgi:hypothetical protein